MNCFVHRDRPALGICKSCSKGLCAECLVEVPDGIACKGRCETRVDLVNRTIDANKQVLRATRLHVALNNVIFFGFGAVLLLGGVASAARNGLREGIFPLVFGALLVLLGFVRMSSRARFPELK